MMIGLDAVKAALAKGTPTAISMIAKAYASKQLSAEAMKFIRAMSDEVSILAATQTASKTMAEQASEKVRDIAGRGRYKTKANVGELMRMTVGADWWREARRGFSFMIAARFPSSAAFRNAFDGSTKVAFRAFGETAVAYYKEASIATIRRSFSAAATLSDDVSLPPEMIGYRGNKWAPWSDDYIQWRMRTINVGKTGRGHETIAKGKRPYAYVSKKGAVRTGERRIKFAEMGKLTGAMFGALVYGNFGFTWRKVQGGFRYGIDVSQLPGNLSERIGCFYFGATRAHNTQEARPITFLTESDVVGGVSAFLSSIESSIRESFDTQMDVGVRAVWSENQAQSAAKKSSFFAGKV